MSENDLLAIFKHLGYGYSLVLEVVSSMHESMTYNPGTTKDNK